MFSLKNLVSTNTAPSVPWLFKCVPPADVLGKEGKKARDEWINNPSTEWDVYSGVEGINASMRISKAKGDLEGNPPYRLHAFVADYDAPVSDEELISGIARLGGKTPAYFERTMSGNSRFVWLFEAPIAVPNREFLIELLRLAQRSLKIDLLSVGLDEPAWLEPNRYYTNSGVWAEVSDYRIPSDLLQGWLFEVAKKHAWKREESAVEIPLPIVWAELKKLFPLNGWPQEFEAESQGPTFWIPESTSPKSAIVKTTGLYTFSANAPKPFWSWQDLLGAAFCEEYKTKSLGKAVAGVYYDSMKYWMKVGSGVWRSFSKEDMASHLQIMRGMNADRHKGAPSEIDEAMEYIRHWQYIEGAAPCAFQSYTIYTGAGPRILNTHTRRVMPPADSLPVWGAEGGFPWLSAYFDYLFEPFEQKDFFMAWLRRLYKGAYDLQMERGQNVFLIGPPGCLSGDTQMRYLRGARNSGRAISLRDLYKKFNGIPTDSRPWADLSVATYLHSFDQETGAVVYNKVVSVIDSGLKPVVLLKTVGGRKLKLTSDHPVLTEARGYVQAGDLSRGDSIIVRGSMKPSPAAVRHGRKPRVVIEGLKYYASGWEKKVTCNGIVYEYRRQHRARLVVEALLNGMTYEDFLMRLRTDPNAARLPVLKPSTIVHHIDENPLNDAPENLAVLTKPEHDRLHTDQTNFNTQYTTLDSVASVTPVGTEETYDIQMEAPLNNFATADGLLVHNTGKTLLSQNILNKLLSGAVDAQAYLLGDSTFNSQLFESALWLVDDNSSTVSAQKHAVFSSTIKKLTSNQLFEYNKKFSVAATVEWLGRVFVTANDDEESLRIIPDLEMSSLGKTMLFRTTKKPYEFPSSREIEAIFNRELPHFARWLLEWEPPAHTQGTQRYGVACYHEVSLLKKAEHSSRSNAFSEILEDWAVEYFRDHPTEQNWSGTAFKLLKEFSKEDDRRAVVKNLTVDTVSRQLGALKGKGHKIESAEKGGARIWIIQRIETKK